MVEDMEALLAAGEDACGEEGVEVAGGVRLGEGRRTGQGGDIQFTGLQCHEEAEAVRLRECPEAGRHEFQRLRRKLPSGSGGG